MTHICPCSRVQCGGRLYNINALLMGVGGTGVGKERRPISKNKEEAELFILFAGSGLKAEGRGCAGYLIIPSIQKQKHRENKGNRYRSG